MPKKTFYNLPAEKRDKIIRAIKEEFSRVSYNKVSINKIIQLAGIPRGSFYQYFEGKDDMIEYILDYFRNRLIEIMKQSLIETNGDLFKSFNYIFGIIINFIFENNKGDFFKNIIGNVKIVEKFSPIKDGKSNCGKDINKILPYINSNSLRINNEEDLRRIFQILISVTRDACIESLIKLSNIDDVKKDYYEKLELLKHGFLR
ncbi:MAG: TetR/AcrR family transcriptional regulator [Clostridiales bacterium]|nr:TetR/AcrR family transcriptional regulator [Clostridiales bacterium]